MVNADVIGKLERLVGGRDRLVERCLALRSDARPFVGARAEKTLLFYADDERVEKALGNDLQSPSNLGLAQVVAVGLDSIPNADVRGRLAQKIIEKSKQEPGFRPFARSLMESADPAVSKLARDAL